MLRAYITAAGGRAGQDPGGWRGDEGVDEPLVM